MEHEFRDASTAILSLYTDFFGATPASINKLPQSGSSRVYFRITNPKEVIARIGKESILGAFNTNLQENANFILIDEFFTDNDVAAPYIYCKDTEHGDCYLLEDLGDTTLFSLLATASDSQRQDLIREALSGLARLQTLPDFGNVYDRCNSPFNARMISGDLNYFKYCFLKPIGVEFDEDKLQDDLDAYCQQLISLPESTIGFMYRDCQSRNVMVHNGHLYWIDFQSGRRGPCTYDVVSFLWQARANFSMELREEMAIYYAEEFAKHSGASAEEILDTYYKLIPLRVIQTLGAYGFRGLMEGKAHFIQSIPQGLHNLSQCLPMLSSYPTLQRACRDAIELWQRHDPFCDGEPHPDRLTIRVESFSYRKGYPRELSGNGGGFIFDCRYMHNPGRYDQYKPLNGTDEPVMQFLEEQGEIELFLDHCCTTIFPAIDKYLKRGFTNLYIGFGCTGGRHRSVYSAEHMAEAIHEIYPEVIVELNHREQNIHRILKNEQ
jgi:aminoglycoside/choline kinase family phosphotransferase